MTQPIRLATFIAAVFCVCDVSRAALVLRIESPGPVAAGETVNVTVFASSPDDSSTLSSYNLTFDVGGDGFGTPAGLGSPTVTSGTVFGNASLTNNTNPMFNFDFSVSDDAATGSFDLGPEEVDLFTLSFDTTAAGVFNLDFVNPTSPVNLFEVTGQNVDNPTLLNGAITVTAVPEPASSSLLAVGLGGYCVARRRRRRKGAV